MAISRVGAAGTDGTSITIPAGHMPNDLLLMFAFAAAATSPTVASGWTNRTSQTGTASALRVAYKVATSSSETSGTWTNATGLVCVVYRGADTSQSATSLISISGLANTSTTSKLYSGINPVQTANCWGLFFAGIKSAVSNIETQIPTGTVLVNNTVGAANEYVLFDTNGPLRNQALKTSSLTINTAAESMIMGFSLREDAPNLQNSMGLDVGDGMSTGEKIR